MFGRGGGAAGGAGAGDPMPSMDPGLLDAVTAEEAAEDQAAQEELAATRRGDIEDVRALILKVRGWASRRYCISERLQRSAPLAAPTSSDVNSTCASLLPRV